MKRFRADPRQKKKDERSYLKSIIEKSDTQHSKILL